MRALIIEDWDELLGEGKACFSKNRLVGGWTPWIRSWYALYSILTKIFYIYLKINFQGTPTIPPSKYTPTKNNTILDSFELQTHRSTNFLTIFIFLSISHLKLQKNMEISWIEYRRDKIKNHSKEFCI